MDQGERSLTAIARAGTKTFNVILNAVKNLFFMAHISENKLSTADCRWTGSSGNILSRLSNNLPCCFLLLVFLASGCSAITGGQKKKLTYEKLAAPYNQIILNRSITLDVLPIMQRSQKELGSQLAETEFLSKSQYAVASLGQSKNGYMTWFNLVTFGRDRPNVIRKAFFVVNDKETSLGTGTTRSLTFDCQTVLPDEILTKRYASESSRQIDILSFVFDSIRKDLKELTAGTNTTGQSNQMLSVCGMLLNQTFDIALRRLESSPILATRLNEPGGVRFEHINFNQGAIRMAVNGDIATIHIRLGALADTL